MAMDTTSAISRSARRLKDAAVDAVIIPSTEELLNRESAELRAARDRRDVIAELGA